MTWTLVYWLLTAMTFLLVGWRYSNGITNLLSKKYVKPFVFLILSIITIMGVYGCFVGEQVMFLEFNRDRNDTTLTTCFETPPVTRFEYKYNCGNNEECAILYYDCNGENSTIQHFVNNETEKEEVITNNKTASIEITSISWEAK